LTELLRIGPGWRVVDGPDGWALQHDAARRPNGTGWRTVDTVRSRAALIRAIHRQCRTDAYPSALAALAGWPDDHRPGAVAPRPAPLGESAG